MKIGEVGERFFLTQLCDLVFQANGSQLGFDEDASDMGLEEGLNIVLNVDTFVSSTDRLPGMSDAQVGRKTAVMTLSDIVVKGARPLITMLSLCISPDHEVNEGIELVRGFSQYCIRNGIRFLGGDTGSAKEVILTGVALGTVEPTQIVKRGGAREGDLIIVTEDFGLTSVAYKMLLENREVSPNLGGRALEAVYRPELYLDLVPALARQHLVTSAMDSSDGLAITLNTMSEHSNMAFIIDRLPIAEGVEEFAVQHELNLLQLVMQGGEEFIPVMTIPPERLAVAKEIARQHRVRLTVIGHVENGTGVYLKSDGEPGMIMLPRGYDKFKEWS